MDTEILKKLYKITQSGIIGVEEIVKKVKDKCLEKLMLDQKKDYLVIQNDILNILKKDNIMPKSIDTLKRISNDIEMITQFVDELNLDNSLFKKEV